jgi:integrase/recombinase XerC
MEKHLDHLRLSGYSPATIYARRRILLRLKAVLPVPLCEATPEMLTEWRAGLAVTDDAVVTYVSHIRGFYRWCEQEGFTESNPAARLPVPRTGRRLPRPVGEEDFMRAVALAPPRIRPWLVLAGQAGFRAREIAYLRRDAVLESAVPPVLIVSADAGKGRRERLVPMSAFVIGELRAAGLPQSGFVFPRHDGQGGPNAPWLISQLASRHLHECGVAATLHQLRHRFLTQAWRVTHDLRLVQELAGHASPVTTAGYTLVDNPEAVAAVEAIPAPARLRVAR